ncbi:hypothetical protein [Quatrionicoccus australiensis]|uniref:hypothetical protein n=1 Tax=Quatrionicoccus australiensis TaxID=138118 RepID=UPI001CFAA18A|nr:hypothetical protein [Quatrionicoccus australiensis]MCB4361382.1 hypothetical protein [Quatrionicoccus australiensis]
MINPKHFSHFFCSLIATSSVLVSGCALRPVGIIDDRSTAPSDAEAVVVHGMKQPGFRYVFVKGKIENGMFQQTKHVGVLIDKPTNGYLVGKIEAGDVIALILAGRTEREDNGPNHFSLGCGTPVRVFTVPGGKVSYLGDAAMSIIRDREVRFTYSDDFQNAKSYIDASFPALKNRLEPIASQVVPYKCPPTYQYYTIYK